MKRSKNKEKKVTKGAPTAVLLSIAIHAGLFFLAGLLVVFTVVKKEEQKFEPPKAIDRPKMKLKKPKVKVKKSSKPKPTTRIVTKMNRANMPEIQLPEMSSMGDGLGGGMVGGFDMMPDLEEVSIFGSGMSVGNDLEGTFYDFKRNREGNKHMVALGEGDFKNAVEKFIRKDWKTSTLGRYYRSPNTLYTPAIMVGEVKSMLGPWAFNEPDTAGYFYMLHYKGQIVHQDGGRFRFWGMGDNFMLVRVNGKVVFDFGNQYTRAWDGKRSKMSSYHMAYWPAWYGSWIDLEPGVALEMEVIFGEYTGGLTAAMLCIEEDGVEYPSNLEGGPMLPVFKTAELTRDQVDAIYEYLNEDHYSVTNGPIFSDYSASTATSPDPEEDEADLVVPEELPPETNVRLWTLKSGKSMEAEFVVKMGNKVVLKKSRGKQVKIPFDELSEEDHDYLLLASPPPFKITFLKNLERFKFENLPLVESNPPVFTKFTGGTKIQKNSRQPYPRSLKVELFTIAAERDGNNYVLMDRSEESFTPSEENDGILEFYGNGFWLRDYVDGRLDRRGEKFQGHMVVVTDERGEIIAQSISNTWMLEIIEFLREFPVGRHFNKAGERVYPPRPELNRNHW